jgi:23S rRNA (cytidine1920-2'-O)/16S rRNA (cytidine1409-2'-O)-methyltransferase
VRLDAALASRDLARSRSHGKELILAGRVSVGGVVVTKVAHPVSDTEVIEVERPDHYVSRAAHKLMGALDDAGVEIRGRVLDAGASTGGFTQVLLERGADTVYAIDVGHGQLNSALRHDPRVVLREGVNVRSLALDHVDGEPVDMIVADLSFISLTLVLRPLLAVLSPSGRALVLVKPQFEAGRGQLDGHGVVRDPVVRRAAVDRVAGAAELLGWVVAWRGTSRLPGPAGNVESFLLLTRTPTSSSAVSRV